MNDYPGRKILSLEVRIMYERERGGVMLLSLKNNMICPLLNLTQNVCWALTNFSKFPPIK